MLQPLIALLLTSMGAQAGTPPEAAAQLVRPTPPPTGSGFTPLVLHQVRAVGTNVVSTNPFLDGQVIGRLGGTNGTTVLTDEGLDLDGDGQRDEDIANAGFVEQRVNAFLTWAPPVMNGELAFTAGFEVDFLWGDQSYGTGGNVGGGVGADQVNLQTRRLHMTYAPPLGARHKLEVVVGQQFMADGAYNPATARPDDLFRTGGGLKLWGTEAAGVTAYGRVLDSTGDRLRYKLSRSNLVENGSGLSDDVTLWMADLSAQPVQRLWVGLHGALLNDASGGRGGTLGVGPASQLSGLQGGPELELPPSIEEDPEDPDATIEVPQEPDARVAWFGVDLQLNHRLDQGPVGATAAVYGNTGSIYLKSADDIRIFGWMATGELRARYAPGAGSVARLEGLMVSRDGTGESAYTGMVTGNAYGVVGAYYGTHGCYLLFPDRGAINRLSPAVQDISNGGDGLIALTGSVGYDLIPHKLNATVGGGWARSTESTPTPLGAEVNGRLSWRPWLLSDLSLTAARLMGSEVNDASATFLAQQRDPDAPAQTIGGDAWTIILSMDNLLF